MITLDNLKYQLSIGNYRNVIKIADRLLKKDEWSEDYVVLMHRAIGYVNLHEEQEALRSYLSITELYPNESEPKIHLATIYLSYGSYELAKEQLTSAKNIDPNNPQVLDNLLLVAEHLKDYSTILKLTSERLACDPTDFELYLIRAGAWEMMRKYDLAIKDIEKAISLINDDEFHLQMALNQLGYTYAKMNEIDKAELYLRKAIAIDQTEPFQYNNLGLVLAKSGKIEEGLRLINHSIDLYSDNSYAYKNRAKVHLMKGNQEKARLDLEKAKSLHYKLDYDNEVEEMLDQITT